MMDPRMITQIRYGILGALVLFSLIVIGLAGHLISGITAGLLVPDFIGLDIAIGVITMVVVIVSLAIDFFRKGAFTSMVATELAWSSLLSIFWVAAAGDTSALFAGISCSAVQSDGFGGAIILGSALQSSCHEVQALIAFTWFCFLISLGWLVTLIYLTITAYTRGNISVWTAPVAGTDFFAQKSMGGQPQGQMEYGGVPQQQYTVQPQYTGGPVPPQPTGQIPQQTYPPAGYNASPVPGSAQV